MRVVTGYFQVDATFAGARSSCWQQQSIDFLLKAATILPVGRAILGEQ